MATKARKTVPVKGWRAVGALQAVRPALRVPKVPKKPVPTVLGPAWWVGLDRKSFNESIKGRFPKAQPSYGRRDV